MQNLIVGTRYGVAHPDGSWKGECTVTKVLNDVVFYEDMKVTFAPGIGDGVITFLEKEWNQLVGFSFVDLTLENK